MLGLTLGGTVGGAPSLLNLFKSKEELRPWVLKGRGGGGGGFSFFGGGNTGRLTGPSSVLFWLVGGGGMAPGPGMLIFFG